MTPRRLAGALAGLALVALAGCSGATYDQAYGRPDATRWTYFEGSAERVLAAIEAFYDPTEIRVESVAREEGGVVLTLASRRGGSDTAQILVQRSPVERFGARAQMFPERRPLPRELEAFVSAAGD